LRMLLNPLRLILPTGECSYALATNSVRLEGQPVWR